MRTSTAEVAVSGVKSGDRVFIHGMAAAPSELIEALVNRADELLNVEITHLHTEAPAPYIDPKYRGIFYTRALFVGANVRPGIATGMVDYVPVFLSEVPRLFRSGMLPIDWAFMHVSPPDKHGYCSLGISVDASLAALQTARHAVAIVNPQMPRTHGDSHIHIDRFEHLVPVDRPLPEHLPAAISETEARIGKYVTELIEDGATLQMGIGAIPNAVLAALKGHKQLGIHTEMFSDGVIDLVECGAITGELKTQHPGKIVAGFVSGTQRLYDFVDDNPNVSFRDIAYVNDTAVIRKLPKMTAINSAIEIDVTGQVCADSIGTRQYSGVGGQMDFVRGAMLSPGGKSIFALPSITSKGESRIVNTLKPGAGVVTTRAHVMYVATEYGVANLQGKTLKERAVALARIAHPEHRSELQESIHQRFGNHN